MLVPCEGERREGGRGSGGVREEREKEKEGTRAGTGRLKRMDG